MHGSFDIDEEKRIVIIDNKGHDRNLKTEIPFSWFVEYAKNDILNKKISNEYTVLGFYHNKYKEKKKNHKTEKELKSNILYSVKILGATFNINYIENKIKELYKKYSDEDNNEKLSEKQKEKIEELKKLYNKK